jgi:hypothetical protein
MKSLLWKEWRENLKWAALPLLLLGAIMAFLGPPSIMEYRFLLFLSLVAAVAGSALGFLQTFFESQGARRALLLHRPVSPTQVFLAKAAAGLSLYLLALGIPFAYAVWWTATPGHLAAPFTWPMALPWLADLLAGAVWYFAGMLTALREARWYGSRGLGLAAALLCSFLVWALPEFWQALLVIGLMGAPLAVAAWGSFLTGGTYAPQPRLAKTALVTTFLAGLLLVSVLAKALVGSWSAPDSQYSYNLDRRGRVLVVHRENHAIGRVTDLEGRVPEELQGKPLDHKAIRDIEAPGAAPDWPRFRSYRNSGRFYVPYQNASSLGGEQWYYVFAEGRLLGYEKRSKRLIGSIGPDGFVPPGQQPKGRFAGELYYPPLLYSALSPDYLGFSGGVYRVDFARRTVRPLFAPAPDRTVLWAVRWWDQPKKQFLAFVGTDRSVHLADETGALLFSAPFVQDPENYQVELVCRLESPRRYVVWYGPSWRVGPKGRVTLPSYLVEFDPAGREVARRTVPPRPVAEPLYAQALFGLVTPPGETALVAGTLYYSASETVLDHGFTPLLLFVVNATRHVLPGGGWLVVPDGGPLTVFVALMVGSAVACALTCLLLGRRYAFSRGRRIGWLLFGLVWGPLGLLLLLALEEWPARIACPQCRKPRVVTRDTCEHCAAPHAPAATDGTEIFEQTGVTLRAALAGR